MLVSDQTCRYRYLQEKRKEKCSTDLKMDMEEGRKKVFHRSNYVHEEGREKCPMDPKGTNPAIPK